MRPELQNRIAALAADRESGASEILAAAIAILQDALTTRADIVEVAKAVCAAQPTMAPLWNAAGAAVEAREDPQRFARFVQRVARAPDAVARFAASLLDSGEPTPLRLATISYSGTVRHVLESLSRRRPLHVMCSESRPALEGRTLATRLAASGIAVTVFSDAAIGHALGEVSAAIVGADAVAPEFFFNKSGTRLLASAALQQGVPLYVLASREKYVTHALAARLQLREGSSSEIWKDAPPGITVRNPYFEPIPVELGAGFVTDIGVLGSGEIPGACEANSRVSDNLM